MIGNLLKSPAARPYLITIGGVTLAAMAFIAGASSRQDDISTAADMPAPVATPKSVMEEWDSPRPVVVPSGKRLRIHAEPHSESPVLANLMPGAVAYGAARLLPSGDTSFDPWIRLRSHGGVAGWCQSSCGAPVAVEEAEELVLRDKQRFEQRLRQLLDSVTVAAVQERRLHPASNIVELLITTPLTSTQSSSSYVVSTSAIMKGALLGINTYKVDFEVTLFVDLNRELLTASSVSVERVDFIGETKNEWIRPKDVANLLMFLP